MIRIPVGPFRRPNRKYITEISPWPLAQAGNTSAFRILKSAYFNNFLDFSPIPLYDTICQTLSYSYKPKRQNTAAKQPFSLYKP